VLDGTALSVGRAFGLHRPAITYLRGWRKTIDIPLIGVIEGGPDGPIVVDTGADADRAEEFHKLRVEQSDGERPDAALRSLGVEPDEVRVVVNTHLHWDHSSNNHLFRNAEVIIYRRRRHARAGHLEALDCEVIPSHDPRVLERRVFA
jgi:N-acyl homoserine lactone hydrolase